MFIYNIADHKDAFSEVGAQGISCTAGVPPVAAALLIAGGVWDGARMVNAEDPDPRPFLWLLNTMGLLTFIRDAAGDRALTFDV